MNNPITFSTIEKTAMRRALVLAAAAGDAGEIPVGAVVYDETGCIVGEGQNCTVGLCDPGAHAEMLALRAAAKTCRNYRLHEYYMAVTLEPCAMCAGAVFWARLQGVVFGAADSKSGAVGSVVSLQNEPRINHHTKVRGGLMADESARLLKQFFQERRSGAKLSDYAQQAVPQLSQQSDIKQTAKSHAAESSKCIAQGTAGQSGK